MIGKQAIEGESDGKPEPELEGREWSELTSVCLTNVFFRLTIEDRFKGPVLACRSLLDAVRDASHFVSFDIEPSFHAVGRHDLAACWSPAFECRIDSLLLTTAKRGADSVREIRVRHCFDRSLLVVGERMESA